METFLTTSRGATTAISAEDAQTSLDNYVYDCVNGKGETSTNVVKAFRFDRGSFDDVLSDENCVYVRIYLGRSLDDGEPTAIVVGVDRYNENLTEKIYNNTVLCPVDCPVKHFN